MDICKQELCTGCMACADKCKKGAITFIKNYDGFLYPHIDLDKCNNCGLCKKVCPANHSLNKQVCDSLSFPPEVYLIQANDSERQKSSSGAFCAILAKSFINDDHYVAGCVFNNGSIKHIITNNMSDLEHIRGSKYVQSNMAGCYLEVQSLLKHGEKVLFTGLPCHVAALKSFLVKNYDNLTTVDLICHGVCSKDLLLNVVKRELLAKGHLSNDEVARTEVTNILFRNKNIADHTFSIFYKINEEERVLNISSESSLFYKIFYCNIALRKSCGYCKFSGAWPRQGDFTAGDFRGIPEFSKFLDQKGTSIVFANTKAAVDTLSKLNSEYMCCMKVPFQSAKESQLNLTQSSTHHPSRELFLKSYQNFDNIDISTKELIGRNVAIINFCFEESNFGAVLTCAALYNIVQNLGYTPRVIDYIPYFAKNLQKSQAFQLFKQNELKFTNRYLYGDSLTNLNDSFDSFIVGSDQVLNHRFIDLDRCAYLLTFAKVSKKMICYAGSFGLNANDYFKMLSQDDCAFYSKSLNIFDAISVREPSSGLKICEDFGCFKSQAVLDPVFVCGVDYWLALSSKAAKQISDNEVVQYILAENSPIYNIVTPKGYGSITRFGADGKDSPYLWLNSIANCKLFITDSFHGTCFALIFNRPFVVCSDNEKLLVRINELLELIDPKLKERIVLGEIKDIDQTLSQLHAIDWLSINQRIEELKADSLLFLKNNLDRVITPDELERKSSLKCELAKTERPKIKRKLLFYRIKRLSYRLLFLFNKQKYQNKANKYQALVRVLKIQASYFSS